MSLDILLDQLARISTSSARDDPRLVRALIELVSQLLLSPPSTSSSTVSSSSGVSASRSLDLPAEAVVVTRVPDPSAISDASSNLDSASFIISEVQTRDVNPRIRLRPTRVPTSPISLPPSLSLVRQRYFSVPVDDSSSLTEPTLQQSFLISRAPSLVTSSVQASGVQATVDSSIVPQVDSAFRTAELEDPSLSLPLVSNAISPSFSSPRPSLTVRLPSVYERLMPKTSRPTPRWQVPTP